MGSKFSYSLLVKFVFLVFALKIMTLLQWFLLAVKFTENIDLAYGRKYDFLVHFAAGVMILFLIRQQLTNLQVLQFLIFIT